MKPKILIFSTSYFPMVGGAEVAIKQITDRIEDYEFDLICAKQRRGTAKVERVGNVTVYRVGFGLALVDKLLVPVWGAGKALRLNKDKQYQAFWCMMATYASGAAYIANWFQKRVPIILTLQEGDSEAHFRFKWFGLIDLSWKMALVRTDKLTVISNYLGMRAKQLGFKGEPILIPNGVDIEKFASSNFQISKKKDQITLITTSRLNVKNAIRDVIEALKYLPTNVHFQILGTGELERDLRKQVKDLKLEERVEFAGLVPYEKIPEYLHNADIFIRPSLSEGMGNSFVEAMAAGVPVIATPVGGIPDFLFDPEANPDKPSTGLFVPPQSPKLIAFQVQKLINDRVLCDKIIINAKRLVLEKYDWSLIARYMKEQVFSL